MFASPARLWVYLVVAHEWGHAIQYRVPRSLVVRGRELQADCLAATVLPGIVGCDPRSATRRRSRERSASRPTRRRGPAHARATSPLAVGACPDTIALLSSGIDRLRVSDHDLG